jgi:hypothetical protein
MKKIFTDRIKILYVLFFMILLIELGGSIVGLFNSNSEVINASKSNIFLIIVTGLVIVIPWRIEYKYEIDIPDILEFVVLAMLFIAVILGFLHDYYVYVDGFDKITHMLSGVTLALLSFQLIVFLNRYEKVKLTLGAGMTAIMSFAFSMTLLVVWEFYEFTVDVISFHREGPGFSNMQRYQWINNSTFFPQDYGLFDTMIDLWVGALGALIVALVGYFIIRKNEIYKLK